MLPIAIDRLDELVAQIRKQRSRNCSLKLVFDRLLKLKLEELLHTVDYVSSRLIFHAQGLLPLGQEQRTANQLIGVGGWREQSHNLCPPLRFGAQNAGYLSDEFQVGQ